MSVQQIILIGLINTIRKATADCLETGKQLMIIRDALEDAGSLKQWCLHYAPECVRDWDFTMDCLAYAEEEAAEQSFSA